MSAGLTGAQLAGMATMRIYEAFGWDPDAKPTEWQKQLALVFYRQLASGQCVVIDRADVGRPIIIRKLKPKGGGE